ncbi:MAG: GyrI-like domain-containing protein [Deltaproteobacteria bacterium]
MNYNFEVSEQPAQPVLSMRKRTPVSNLPQELGRAYNLIIQYLNELGEQPKYTAFAAYYNLDMNDLDVEMGFPVSKAIFGKGEINASEIPAGKQVSCMYKGPYNQMESVYNEINKWMNEKGFVPTGICYEFYYNSPMDVPESELLTKIVFPIK